MILLHNRISNKVLKSRMLKETKEKRITVSFYKYFNIKNPIETRNILYKSFSEMKVFGRIYIAFEGINAQISIYEKYLEKFRRYLYSFDQALDKLLFNFALEDNGKSFWVLRFKVRKKIISDGINDTSFDPSNIGEYLEAEEVNTMLDDPEVVFVDMRNHYEYEIGHFENALEIPANTFREQLEKVIKIMKKHKNKKIVMYCTGGIRCEKSTAWMKHNGFSKVFHIKGGIIGYINQAREKGLPIRFIGNNFVFDERMIERISKNIISHCCQCGNLCDTYTNCKNNKCHLLFIQCFFCKEKFSGFCSKCIKRK